MFRTTLYSALTIATCALLFGCRGEDAARLKSGGQAYLAQCAICHGVDGTGHGPLSDEIVDSGKTPPVSMWSERVQGLERDAFRQAVVSAAHMQPGSSMPAWGAHLGPEWTDRIVDYCLAMPELGDAGRESVEAYLADTPGTPYKGREVYVMYCSSCHGAWGKGDGFFTSLLDGSLEPANLVDAVPGLSDEDLRGILEAGGAHAPDAPGMPGWLHTLTSGQRDALAGYLRALPESNGKE